MQVKVSYLAILCLLLISSVIAQEDKLYLHNGSFICGNIQSIGLDSAIIQLSKGLMKINNDEIIYVKCHKRSSAVVAPGVLDSINKNAFTKGFFYGLQAGVLFGGEAVDPDRTTLAFSVKVHHQFSPWLQLGTDIGFENYFRFKCVPILLYYRSDLTPAPGGLFAFVSGGYGLIWENDDQERQYEKLKGGLAFKLGAGYMFKVDSRPFEVSLGYSLQKVEESYSTSRGWGWRGGGVQTIISRSMNRMLFKL